MHEPVAWFISNRARESQIRHRPTEALISLDVILSEEERSTLVMRYEGAHKDRTHEYESC
jgi:hypothetical protein